MKRVFLIVLDSFGVGEAPDAAAFGDAGASTLRSVSRSPFFRMDHLAAAGFGLMDGVTVFPKPAHPTAAVARMRERSAGKDTTIGHWEIAGLISPKPLPTYPHGFPADVIAAFEQATGRGVLCNRPYSGTDVIRDYGPEQLKTGRLIVYTSADSVFQIAAHEDVIPLEELYADCRIARKLLTGDHNVGRVIARPYVGTPEAGFTRVGAHRHDFSLEPPGTTLLDAVRAAGQDVIAVGKISDIFAGRGVTESVPIAGNDDGMAKTLALGSRDFRGLCFVNLVDFDAMYGHRQDADGYARALAAFDDWLPSFLPLLGPDDLLILTADHGCDPGDDSTDHTREYTPMLAFGPSVRPGSLGTRDTFADIAATVAEALSVPLATPGASFLQAILA